MTVSPYEEPEVQVVDQPQDKNAVARTHVEYALDGVSPIDESRLPKGYYYSPLFVGSYAASAFGLMAGVGAFTLITPNLGKVYADIGGPGTSIVWAAIIYILMLGVVSTLVGRVTDLFGRRWFFISGSALGLVGCIVCARAQNIPTLIGGMTLIGAAAATQGSFAFVIGELVPIKYRFVANAGLYFIGAPFNAFGAKTGTAIANNPNMGWRWIFYVFIIINGLATACWYLFYYPPTFKMLHHGRASKRQLIAHFDYIGFILFTAGVTLLMLGLNWGGSLYAWDGAQVLCTLVIGAACMIAFFVYEWFASPREPYVPLRLFRSPQYIAVCITVTVVAMAYYGFSIIWPTMVEILYPASPSLLGWKYCAASGMITFGDFVGLAVASYIRHLRYFMVVCMVIGTAFTGAVAVATQHNEAVTASMLVVGCFFLGMVEAISLTQSGIAIEKQDDIGLAVGFAASFRSLGGALASTIYSTILANRLKATIPAVVPAAVVQAGLPATEIPALLQVLQGVLPASSVPGLTDRILAIGLDAYQTANAQAYRTCFLTSIAFCALGTIGSWFCPDLNPETEHLVAKELHKKSEEKKLEETSWESA